MNAVSPLRMNEATYLAWSQRKDRKYELVDGVARLIAGGSYAHVLIGRNVLVALLGHLKKGPCQPFQERRVKIPRGNYRYPDLVVDCGVNAMSDPAAAEPRVIVEVESPSNTFLEESERLEDYQSIPSVMAVVIVAQNRARARVYLRAGEGWTIIDAAGLDASLPIAALELSLALDAIYNGVSFDPPVSTETRD